MGRWLNTWRLLALIWPALGLAGTSVDPKLSLTAEERYDDDALLRRSGGPLGAELMTKLVPRVGLALRGHTYQSEAWYAPDLEFRHLSRSFQINHRGGLELRKRLSRRNTFTAQLQIWRVADPTSLPRMGLGTSLKPVLYGTGELALDSVLSRRFIANLRYRLEGAYFYDPSTPPGAVQAPSAELWYRATRRASVGVEYRFQHFVFGSAQAIAHAPGALFRYRLTRSTTLTVRGGPVRYEEIGGSGLVPRFQVEVGREAHHFELGVQAGQDVVGASGYAIALWTQYAGGYAAWRVGGPLRLFGGGYYFRNGRAPGNPSAWFGPISEADGYAIGGGVEWRFHRKLVAQAQLDHVDQLGPGRGAAETLSRNIAAVRLVMTAW
jgi:hypothetical protein